MTDRMPCCLHHRPSRRGAVAQVAVGLARSAAAHVWDCKFGDVCVVLDSGTCKLSSYETDNDSMVMQFHAMFM